MQHSNWKFFMENQLDALHPSVTHQSTGIAAARIERAEEYLGRSIHHVLIYPYLSVQSPLQQLRVLRLLASNRTLSEIWHFRRGGVTFSNNGTSEAVMRSQFEAWTQYMREETP
jgi:hypothetical protein